MAATLELPQDQPTSTAGVDTTTGHGADSVFTQGLTDPWRSQCLSDFIDVLINHAHVEFPLWSKTVGEVPDDDRLPLIFTKARRNGLLQPMTNTFADQLQLEPGRIIDEFSNFSRWAIDHADKLMGWSKYQFETPRIINVRRGPGPWDDADKLLPVRAAAS